MSTVENKNIKVNSTSGSFQAGHQRHVNICIYICILYVIPVCHDMYMYTRKNRNIKNCDWNLNYDILIIKEKRRKQKGHKKNPSDNIFLNSI